jgi:glycosyltransferase involved in cell wall biosynthesis
MKVPTISLIIPAYNEEKYIGECLEYAIKNSHGGFSEIIVVDNASTDKTREVALQYAGVKVVREDRKGLTRARQRGYEESKGELLAYIDADTHMPEAWVETVIEEFKKNPKLACLSGPYIYHDISKWNQFLVKVLYWSAIAMPAYWIAGYMITGANFAIRRDVLDKMKGFDTSIEFYGEDTNIARRARAFGKVKFKLDFPMYLSGRRLNNQGIYKTAFLYITNFLSEAFYHKPLTKEYKDFR